MAQARSPRGPQPVSGNSRLAETLSATQQFSSGVSIAKPMKTRKAPDPKTDRRTICQPWQREVYRHVNICGEARYAATLFANMAGRAEIGVSEPQTLVRKPVWVNEGPEVEAFAEIAHNVRDRSRLIRQYMLHRVLVGECYLISRQSVETDPSYEDPATRDTPIWEVVAVTEIEKTSGDSWRVRHENGNYIDLRDGKDAVIRMWDPDPNDRMEAWSPFRSLLPTLKEIEWLTGHIFAQVSSRLAGAGVWFVPNNITYPSPPSGAVEGGEDRIAQMNDAEKFMVSVAAASMEQLDSDEPAFPTIVMADAEALAAIDKGKLIQFWSEIDDAAMILRSDAVRRFALGMDLPPEQVLGSSGLAVTGAGGSAGSVNHWGVWANEEQTISAHIEPALDAFTDTITKAILIPACPGTVKVIAYDTASLRLRQDRSKESLELYDRGLLKGEVALRENGFDPKSDAMDDAERKLWLLARISAASPSPEQLDAALSLLGVDLPTVPAPQAGDSGAGKDLPGRAQPPNLDGHPHEGAPRVQHDHSPAPFSAFHAACEGLVLRALEKAGNRMLNDGKRGKDRDRITPPHAAHLTASLGSLENVSRFEFDLLTAVLPDRSSHVRALVEANLRTFCEDLYKTREPYSRQGLITALEGV